MTIIQWISAHAWVTCGAIFSIGYTTWCEVRAWRLRATLRELTKAIRYLQADPMGEKTPTSYFPRAPRASIVPYSPWRVPPPPLAPRLEPEL